jgi:putative CocE/NonD family hydrolase
MLILRWHDHWLKGKDTGILKEPQVKLYMTGAEKYRYEKDWPVPKIDYTKVYLRRWEGLSFEPEMYQPDPDCFLQQPLHLSTKRDSLKYVSPPLPSDLEVTGEAALNMFASIDQPDANWIARVFDVAPGGAEYRINKGYLKASHRATDKKRSTPSRPYHPHLKAEPVTPGEITEYNIEIGNLTHVFRAGHRIKLVIESMESSRDPEMQIHYHPHLNSARTTLHKVYRNREYPSHLILPITGGKDAVMETLSDENFQGGV